MTTIVENNEKVLNLPVIALRGLVVFPNLSIQFDVGRKKVYPCHYRRHGKKSKNFSGRPAGSC